MGCSFCVTGKMGLLRSLTAEEIVLQLFTAQFQLGAPIRNIVFMGMGEPFDNYDNVMQAIQVMTCSAGFCLRASKITVSTSGRVEEIIRFANQNPRTLNLAISLNAPTDAIRTKIMPINRKWDLAALKEAMLYYATSSGRKIFIEYVLLEGVNDSLDDARELARYLEGLPVTINLIPYNTQGDMRFAAPGEEGIVAFRMYLQSMGYHALVRLTKGRSIMAACGQLGDKEYKKNRRSAC